MSRTDNRLPVTLITGFLGAGKTTLLNKILGTTDGPRIAVIVNEFGEAGLDHDLIDAVDEDVVLMQSGCLCCSIRGDLSGTLKSLSERRQSGAATFDRVVIETTGLADPGPVLHTLLVDKFLATTFRMDGVVTVVDAATGPDTLDKQFEAVSQVAMADLLVLSKTDLVTEAPLRAFETRLKGLNPTARIIQADNGTVPVASLWDLSAMRHGGGRKQALSWLHPAGAGLGDEQAHQPSRDTLFDLAKVNLSGLAPERSGSTAASRPFAQAHDARIGSASVVLDHPISMDTFDLWLNTLVLLRGPNILRVKGIVHVESIPTPFVFHGVQHLFDPPVPLHDWPEGDCRSRIVVIARDMTNPELVRSLDVLRAGQPLPPETQSSEGHDLHG